MGLYNSKYQQAKSTVKTLKEELESLKSEKEKAAEEKLKEPWRKFEPNGGWNKEYRTMLADYVKSFQTFGEIEYSKILIVGPVKAGKSSFVNSIASIDKERIANPTTTGAKGPSMTKKLNQYIPKSRLAGQFRLMDTMGIEESLDGDAGFNVQDIIYLMRGNVKPDYQFNPAAPIKPENNPMFVPKPTMKDKPQCPVLVLDAEVFYPAVSMPEVLKLKLRKLKKLIEEDDVPIVIVLTKIDKLCEAEGITINDIYTNHQIGKVVDVIHDIFGVPKMNIYPVQNYSKEESLDDNIDILLLLALRKMLDIAHDRLEHVADQNR